MDLDPWNLVNKLYPDLVFVVEGKKLYYHQAVLAQHSSLIKSLLLKSSCCKCKGDDCRRSSENIFITLSDAKISTVQYVLDIIYAGSGNIAGDSEEYKKIIDMLGIDTIVVAALDAPEGFVLEETLGEESNVYQSNKNVASEVNGNILELEARKVTERKHQDELKKKREEKKGKKEKNSDYNKTDTKKNPEDDARYQTNTKPSGIKPHKSNVKDEEIVLIDDSQEQVTKSEPIEKFSCPFPDCSSESRTSQSIKVHLALVHYKKTIQAEYPNWRTQKCEQCDRGFGQMTAYYLHMAQHRKYPYMENPTTTALPTKIPGPPPVSGPGAANARTTEPIRNRTLSDPNITPQRFGRIRNLLESPSTTPPSQSTFSPPSSQFRKNSMGSNQKATITPVPETGLKRRGSFTSPGRSPSGQGTSGKQAILKKLRGS